MHQICCVRCIRFLGFCRTQWTAWPRIGYVLAPWLFCLCMKYLGNCWTDLRQIHKEDVFGPSLRRVWMSTSKIKSQSHQGQKRHFLALLAAFVRFMFDKTSSASSVYLYIYSCVNASLLSGATSSWIKYLYNSSDRIGYYITRPSECTV